MPDREQMQERERQFWNLRAKEAESSLDPEAYRVAPDHRHDRAVPWLPYLGVPEMTERLLGLLGDLPARSVLDLGAGTGFLSTLLALHGAQVTSTDIAEEPLKIARFRASVSGVEGSIVFRRMSGESLQFPDQTFDAVTGAFVLHHLDLKAAVREIHRVLKPGGKAAFIETSARNPLLMWCRNALVGRFGIEQASSEHERPLGAEAERLLAETFPSGVRFHFPNLLFLRLLPAYVGVLRKKPILWTAKGLDELLSRIPKLRPLSYFVVVELTKKAEAGK